MTLTPCICSTCERVLLLLFVPGCGECHMLNDCLVRSVSDSGRSYEKSFWFCVMKRAVVLCFYQVRSSLELKHVTQISSLCIVQLCLEGST